MSQGTGLNYETPQTQETAREGSASTGTWGKLTPDDVGEELKAWELRGRTEALWERNATNIGQNIKLPLMPLENRGPCPRLREEATTQPSSPSHGGSQPGPGSGLLAFLEG